MVQATATTEDAYQLLHDGTLVLADIERNGICIDTKVLQHNIDKVGRKIAHQEELLKEDPVWAEWRKRFGRDAKMTSRDQLAKILTTMHPDAWGEEDRTATGKPRMDEETLSRIEIPFVQNFVKLQKLHKARSTYLIGIQRETVDGLLHPMFGLANAITYRSSSELPNFQNIPVRLPWVAELVRSCFIPRPGNRLMEIDFKGLEVCVSPCYNKDPKLIAYVSDDKLDMHRDMAAEIFKCTIEQITKEARYAAKNGFVFPEFYGDYFVNCAKNIWGLIQKTNIKTASGTPMFEHLQQQGIRRLGACNKDTNPLPGTFEWHLKEVERAFWYDRFPVYTQWKKDWFNEYEARGFIEMYTGFIVRGFYTRNQIINSPVQGSAFHCLLWCLIRLQRWLVRHKKRTLIVGQIHDSMLLDYPPEEEEELVQIVLRILTEQLPQAWQWIIVPLKVEIESVPEGGSWYDKRKVT